MMAKLSVVLLLAAAVVAQNPKQGAQQTRYGGRPHQHRPVHGGRPSGFGQQGFGNQGAFGQSGAFPHQAGVQGFGQAGGFHSQGGGQGFGQAGGFGQNGRPFQNQGYGQSGFNQGLGGRPFAQHGQNVGAQGSSQLQYNCAATASQGQYGIDETCKKFCKAPNQYWGGAYVCCDVRRGVCPPVRTVCPKFGGGGPVCCFVDSQCQIPTDRCCYDTCLGHKVCKSASKQGY